MVNEIHRPSLEILPCFLQSFQEFPPESGQIVLKRSIVRARTVESTFDMRDSRKTVVASLRIEVLRVFTAIASLKTSSRRIWTS